MTEQSLKLAEAAYKANPEIGRRRLMAAARCTNFAAAKFLIQKHRGVTPAAQAVVQGTTTPPASGVRGFMLKPDIRVLDKRPAATVRSRFYGLAKGRAYPITELAREWGVSAGTLKRHAVDAECFKYVDTTGHDDWEACAMHPDTAAQYCK